MLAEFIIRASQLTPFRGTGGYAGNGVAGFPQADAELARVAEFFDFFRVRPDLRDKHVLDFGCGYGGRTVGYARDAKWVIGVEPFPHVIEKCRAFANERGVENCRFLVNSQTHIPLGDASVDVVLSYDVFEHVTHPGVCLKELHRVLIPGGKAFIVFTPYWGAFSHHLNYITRLPGLHWVFKPETLIEAVNRILSDGGAERFGTTIQPVTYGHLPTVNGLSGQQFLALCRDWEIVECHSTPLFERFRVPGVFINRALNRLSPTIEEALSFNLVCVLQRPR